MAYQCGITHVHDPITNTSFTGNVNEINNSGGAYDTTEWHLTEIGKDADNPQNSPVAGTNNRLDFTYANLKAGTLYDMFVTRKSSNSAFPPVICQENGTGTNHAVVRTLAIVTTPSPQTTSGHVVTSDSPYLTPYNPGVDNILKQAVIVAGIAVVIYLLF